MVSFKKEVKYSEKIWDITQKNSSWLIHLLWISLFLLTPEIFD